MSGSADTRKGNCVKKTMSDGTFKECTYMAKVSISLNSHLIVI